MKIVHIVIAFICMGLISTIFGQESFKLRYNFEKGKSYNYSIEQEEHNESAEKFIMLYTKKLKAIQNFETNEKDNEKIALTMKHENYYSETKEKKETIVSKGEKVIGKKTGIKINTKGDLLKKEFTDSLSVLVDYAFTTAILHVFPENQVKTGETWSVTTVDSSMRKGNVTKIYITTEYKLEAKETVNGAECLKISFQTSAKYDEAVSSKAVTDGVERGTITHYVSSKANMQGALFFDPKRGIPVSIISDAAIKEDMSFGQNFIGPQGGTSKIYIKTKISLNN